MEVLPVTLSLHILNDLCLNNHLNINKINECKRKINKSNPKIQLGFNRRYDPGHNNLRKELLKGKIGKLEKIIITSRDPAPPSIKYLKESGLSLIHI